MSSQLDSSAGPRGVWFMGGRGGYSETPLRAFQDPVHSPQFAIRLRDLTAYVPLQGRFSQGLASLALAWPIHPRANGVAPKPALVGPANRK